MEKSTFWTIKICSAKRLAFSVAENNVNYNTNERPSCRIALLSMVYVLILWRKVCSQIFESNN
ncbi:hypothetical protein [Emticicia sp. W12TSBA100-4]|uniref:hypothetical protein n=1 Tax=Emticicia sp. W12TSBA100-4 TaxID=3160965 RepID=UPI0033061FEF